MPDEEASGQDGRNEILDDVKAICGITPENSAFDVQLAIYANGVISSVRQLGVISGPLMRIDPNGQDKWSDLEPDPELQALLVEYVCLKTRMGFDPPRSTSVETAYTGRIDELEFRIGVLADTREEEGD